MAAIARLSLKGKLLPRDKFLGRKRRRQVIMAGSAELIGEILTTKHLA